MQRIVFLDQASLPVPLPPVTFPHVWVSYPATRAEERAVRLQGASIAVVNKVRMDAELLAALPDLRMIALAATGSDNIDLQACQERGIAVSNIRDYALDSVPEHALAMLFALRRALPHYRQAMQQGEWQQAGQFCLFGPPLLDVAGSRLGIVGHGSLGQALARKAQALGMQVWFAERKGAVRCRPGYHPFDEVLQQCDAISLHCPLTPETRHLIGARELALMPRHAIVLNTARGALIEPHALLQALRAGRLGGAGIDVLPEEPPIHGHPLLEAALPNLLVTPHVAWASQQAMQQLAIQLVENLHAFWAGERLRRLV
ncbi:D-2-hydroxyacid dehydrogenase [Leeia aquatica]|uniref:D-2-hydroxyacid dehydrogenase n=1 Tax=Leeia aquatica TaxID=2725557 RepID=A0A847S0A5_9NEIS|nr:D-2-hydroxyacid dehydrogenase [Leeia aquatica]NLR76780.1 D-2-hydroxyacid dehydrogenase [Leeia aquatica]